MHNPMDVPVDGIGAAACGLNSMERGDARLATRLATGVSNRGSEDLPCGRTPEA